MKPNYYFKYDFPNEKINDEFIKDCIDNDFSEKQIYDKYGKYRSLGNWEEFESVFIHRANDIQTKYPTFSRTHLIIYDDIFIGTLSLPYIKCKEKKLLDYIKSNTDRLKYIENMDINKLSVVRFNYRISYKVNYKVV